MSETMSNEVVYIQMGPASLPEMTGPELEERLKIPRFMLLPFGATEAHGAHLPLGTDTFEARENCRRAAQRLEARECPVVIGPAIPFGTSSFHMGFTGTISISATTFIALTREICLSLYQSGIRKFAFVHGHDGNLPGMMVAAQEVVDLTPDAEVMVLNWLTPLSKVYHTIQTSKKMEGHGGAGENSRILVEHSQLVRLGRGVNHNVQPGISLNIQGPEQVKTGWSIFYFT